MVCNSFDITWVSPERNYWWSGTCISFEGTVMRTWHLIQRVVLFNATCKLWVEEERSHGYGVIVLLTMETMAKGITLTRKWSECCKHMIEATCWHRMLAMSAGASMFPTQSPSCHVPESTKYNKANDFDIDIVIHERWAWFLVRKILCILRGSAVYNGDLQASVKYR